MAINKNHEFEELDGVKCCIVERSIPADRAEFLRTLLQGNGYTVVVSAIIPKTAAPATEEDGASASPPASTAFTVGVTDMAFNAINAIFGRFLRTKDGEVVTLAYWQQKSEKAEDIPYFER